jgi:hypothetical protein
LQAAGKSIGLDGAIERATALAKTAKRFDEAADGWRARFQANKGDEDVARLFNRTMKRMSHHLVPLQSTYKGTYGQDPYGYTPQTTMMPCLYDIPRLKEMDDGEQRFMLETKLIRDRNRVADALADVTELMEDLLGQIK